MATLKNRLATYLSSIPATADLPAANEPSAPPEPPRPLRPIEVPPFELKEGELSTPRKALAAWYRAAGPDAIRIPKWKSTVEVDFASLPLSQFQERMRERINGTYALAVNQRLMEMRRARAIGYGSGLHTWDEDLRAYRLVK